VCVNVCLCYWGGERVSVHAFLIFRGYFHGTAVTNNGS